ncbi:tape measure protein [uncultured Enterococcus sp.]|uniref:tape measure protein n=1 Tax=uncultured Enterococcus sp. TaxID=167972 RepID=UPI002AA6F426|nr:tape measure protein [uncultured Enterococcus sp.]
MIDVVLEDGSVTKGVANLNQLSGTSEKASLSIGKIATSLGLVKVASKAFDVLKSSIGGAVERFDTLQKFPKVMESLGFSTEQSAAASKKLSDGIDGLPTTLQEVVSSTQRMTAITGDLDKSTDATIAMNNAFLASGASTDAASRGMDQYMKIVSTGKVELDSWTTLQETMPLALQKTAEAMGYAGKTAQNDLYAALKNGTVTFDEFQDKLIELGTGTGMLADLAKKNSLGIGTSFKNLNSSITKGMANVLTKFDEIVQKLSGKSIAQNIDGLKAIINSFFSGVVSGMDLIVPLLSGLGKLFSPLVSVIKSFGNSLKYVFIDTKLAIEGLFGVITGKYKTVEDLKNLFLGVFGEEQISRMLNFGNSIREVFFNVEYVIKDTILAIEGIFGVITGKYKTIEDLKNLFMGVFGENQISQILSFGNSMRQIFFNVEYAIKDTLLAIEGLFGVITGKYRTVEELDNLFLGVFGEKQIIRILELGNKIKSVFDDIKAYISGIDFSGVFDTLASNISSKIEIIKGTIDQLKPVFSSIFSTVVTIVTNIVGAFSNISPQIALFVATIIGVAVKFGSVFGTISGIIVSFVSAIGPAITAITTFASSAGGLTGILGMVGKGILAILTPANLLAAGITILVAGFIHLMTTSESFREKVFSVAQTIVSSIVPVIQIFGEMISNVIAMVVPVIMNLAGQLLPVIEQIITVILDLAAAIAPIIADLVSKLFPVIENIIQAVMNIVTAVAPAVIAVIQTIMSIIQALLPIITAIISVVADMVSNVIAYIGMIVTVVSNIIAIIMSIISPIVAFIGMIISSIMAAISPIIAFVSGVFTTVSAVISTVWNGIMNTTANIFNAIGTIISSISSVVSSVFNTISSTISNVMNGVSSTITNVFNSIKNSWTGLTSFVSGVFDGIGIAIDSLVSSVKGTINAVIGGINGAIGIINKIPGVSIGTIPQLRYGTNNWRGGLAFMNEGGRGEIVNLPNGTQVIPHDISAMYAKSAAQAIGKAISNFSMPDVTAELALGIGPRMTTGNTNVANYYNTVNSGSDRLEELIINLNATVELEAQKVGKLTAVYVQEENENRDFIKKRVKGEG